MHLVPPPAPAQPRPAPARPRAGLRALLAGVLSMTGLLPAHADPIASAGYAEPVQRYGHFALGRPHEYARVDALTDAGRRLSLSLPAHEVFEDLAPRPVRLTATGPLRLLAIVSERRQGARPVLLGPDPAGGDGLVVVSEGPPIGRARRWLNPVGVADLDGDGRAEIAVVTTPHIGGVLRVYRVGDGGGWVEIDAMSGFSNHVYGSPELLLSAPLRVGGRWQLLVPDQPRTRLRLMALQDGRLVETASCTQPRPVEGPGDLRDCARRLGAEDETIPR